jgi:2-desacetyl-2-hydroxyethyl bacteriochlorophyllide A dehydrogenase
MKTIVLDRPGSFSFVDAPPVDRQEAGEALVRIRRIGVCGTDLHAFKGDQPFFTYPRVLGHELGAEIVSIDENNAGLCVGDRCAIEPYLNCGTCVACRRGRTNCCVNLRLLGVHIDGGMCELLSVPVAKLHRSEVLSLDQLALIEPLSIGAHAVGRAGIEPGETALVVGAGPIGLSVIQFASAAGARVIVCDLNLERLKFAAEHFEIVSAIPAGEDLAGKLAELTTGEMPTVVFEATGSQRSMNSSFGLIANGGRLVLVGLVLDDITFYDPDAHRRELTLLCSRNATSRDFQLVRQRLESGAIDINPWITHRVPFEDVIGQFEGWLDPQSRFIKAIVEI